MSYCSGPLKVCPKMLIDIGWIAVFELHTHKWLRSLQFFGEFLGIAGPHSIFQLRIQGAQTTNEVAAASV